MIRVATLLAIAAGPASARVFLETDRALALAFGEGAEIRRVPVFLTERQLADARERAGQDVAIPSALVTRYEGWKGGVRVGVAYFDTHRVRTLDETLMIVVGSDGHVGRIEVVSFGEPPDYLPRRKWLDQFTGKRLDADLALPRGIHGISGATLSARAATDAARRVLAIHEAIEATPEPRPR